MKRIASMFAALMAVASLATVRGAFAADIKKTIENFTGTVTAETLTEAGGDLLLLRQVAGFKDHFAADTGIPG